MARSEGTTRRLFEEMSARLTDERPDLLNAFICPLCLREYGEDAISDKLLSVEHVIASAVGGDVETLTCTQCNNSHGSSLDSHLVRAMEALDALQGNGSIRGVFHNDAGHVAINMSLRSGSKNNPDVTIRVVGKASSPAGVNKLPDLMVDGATQKYTLNFGFIPLQYWRAVLRVGYLAAFHRLGYTYVFSDGAAQVRRVLESETPIPQVIMSAYPDVELQTPFLILGFESSRGETFLIVIFRLRSAMTRHLAVLLPGIDGCTWERLAEIGTELRKWTLTANPKDSTSEIAVRFTDEPITQLRELRIPPRPSVGDQA